MIISRKTSLIFTLLLTFAAGLFAQNPEAKHANKFEQLGQMLRSPNDYRGVDGAPGPEYWQQRADYKIECSLDTKEQRLHGTEEITYFNQSPNTLRYLWLQLDENQHAKDADNHRSNPSSMRETMGESDLVRLENWRELDKYGHNIETVTDQNGKALPYTINKTMMRIDLPQPLKSGEQVVFNIKWNYYCLLYTSPSPRDLSTSRMPSSA